MNESTDNCIAGSAAVIAAAREQKHIALNSAINEIDTVKNHMLDVLNQIRGPLPETAAVPNECKVNEPTLASVLNAGADNILQKCSSMHNILDEIKEELF